VIGAKAAAAVDMSAVADDKVNYYVVKNIGSL